MAQYELKQTEDDGVWVVEGLEGKIIKRVTVIVQQGDDFRDVVNEVRLTNKNVKHDDVFVTPTGKYRIDGALVVPHVDPAPDAAPPQDTTTAATTPQSAPQQPGVPPQSVAVPVIAVDSHGKVYSATLPLTWPKVTNSEIVVEWDKAASSVEPGNIINTIRVPGGDKRIIEIGYNNDQTRVMLEVG